MMKLLLLISLFIFSSQAKTLAPPPSKVKVDSVQQATLSLVQHFNGSVKFHRQSNIASQSSGVVTKLYFNEADRVKKGDLLLELDDKVLHAQVNALRSQVNESKLKLELADIELKRNKKLYDSKGISKQIYDKFYYTKMQIMHGYEALSQTLNASVVALQKKKLYAPFDGMIASRAVQKGEWLNEGASVALLVDPLTIDLLFYIPQEFISTLKKGMIFDVLINQKSYKAKVLGSLLNGDESTRTFGLLMRLQQNGSEFFFQGMQAELSINQNSGTENLLFSRDAIVQKYEKTMVYILEEGKAKAMSVNVLSYKGDKVAVTAKGLSVGMKVITKGNERLYPGAKVIVSD
jgi:membrane fusion protein, multidrug efflux system